MPVAYLNYKRVVGLNLYALFGISYIWNASATANIFNQREKADNFHDMSFDNSKWIFYGSLRVCSLKNVYARVVSFRLIYPFSSVTAARLLPLRPNNL